MAEDKKSSIRVHYTKELFDILKDLEDANKYVAFELLWLNEDGAKYFNGLKIGEVGVSKSFNCFDVNIDGKLVPMRIDKFIQYYFKNLLSPSDVSQFSKIYNLAKNGEEFEGTAIKVPEFVYNPKDVRSTFLSLVTKTYPHFSVCRHEKVVLQFLPDLEEDIVGNYYKIIGDSKQPQTMFTSHLDTADREQKITKLYSIKEGDSECIITDGNSILGADDKSGVAVMLYMMAHNVPGLYYFFIGEERGCIGSGQLSAIYEDVDYLKNIKRCVSFDRRDTCSVITSQLGRTCCSDDFGTALCNEYNAQGLNLSLDPTGIYTDSASFLEEISECTNISVGYYKEHTGDEKQNITFLEKLAKASVQVNWDSLPTVRKIGLDEDIIRKYGKLINDIKQAPFALDIKVIREERSNKVSIQCDMEDSDISSAYKSLADLQVILNRHKINQDVFFDGYYIKIELK